MWNIGMRRGVAKSDPVQAIKRTKEVSRSRYLSVNELLAFLANVGEETPADRMQRMILFTHSGPAKSWACPGKRSMANGGPFRRSVQRR
jgi:hypothetical protein